MVTILFLTLKLSTKFIKLNKIIVMFEHGQLTFLTIWYCHELLVIINESRKGSEMRLHLSLMLKSDIFFYFYQVISIAVGILHALDFAQISMM